MIAPRSPVPHPTPLSALPVCVDPNAKLPQDIAIPLLERARALAAHARRSPDGEAARELAALVDDLKRPVDAEAAQEARQLRADVARARRAIQETRGR